MRKIIVTRHPALLQFLTECGEVDEGTAVLAHVSDPSALEGAHVYGILPLDLAARCGKVTAVTLRVPVELRGVELTLEQVREYAGELATYKVEKL